MTLKAFFKFYFLIKWSCNEHMEKFCIVKFLNSITYSCYDLSMQLLCWGILRFQTERASVCVLICLHLQKMWTVTVMITEVVNKYSSNNSTTASTQTMMDSL
jgi:hypothetical protein